MVNRTIGIESVIPILKPSLLGKVLGPGRIAAKVGKKHPVACLDSVLSANDAFLVSPEAD